MIPYVDIGGFIGEYSHNNASMSDVFPVPVSPSSMHTVTEFATPLDTQPMKNMNVTTAHSPQSFS